MIYGELPKATIHDALKKFLLAEEISPGFYSKNLLMIIKCYTELNSRPAAMEFSKLLLNRERKNQEDEEVHQDRGPLSGHYPWCDRQEPDQDDGTAQGEEWRRAGATN